MLDVSFANPYKDVKFEDLYKLEHSVVDLKRHVVFIQGFRESMQLLFFASAGSRLEGYKESIIHTCSLLYMWLLEEILIHEPNEPTLIQLILSTCDRVIHLENGAVKESYSLDEMGIEKVKDYFIKSEILVTA